MKFKFVFLVEPEPRFVKKFQEALIDFCYFVFLEVSVFSPPWAGASKLITEHSQTSGLDPAFPFV